MSMAQWMILPATNLCFIPMDVTDESVTLRSKLPIAAREEQGSRKCYAISASSVGCHNKVDA